MRYGVIMAGGSGKRLWPLSRGTTPKQLLPVAKGQSLLRLAFDRLLDSLPAERVYVCTGEQHREAILKDLPELPPNNLLGEPEGRDHGQRRRLPGGRAGEGRPGRGIRRRDRRPRHQAAGHLHRPPDGRV